MAMRPISKPGAIRAYLAANADELSEFTPANANAMIRSALIVAGETWAVAFLGRRFSSYAFKLGYRVRGNWSKGKAKRMGKAIPFVGFTPPGGGAASPAGKPRNPQKMITAVQQGTRITATATANRHQIVILIPFGHAVRPETADAFLKTPPWELARISDAAVRAIASAMAGAQRIKVASGEWRQHFDTGTAASYYAAPQWAQARRTTAHPPRRTGARAPRQV
jgi:hypothetical protein